MGEEGAQASAKSDEEVKLEEVALSETDEADTGVEIGTDPAAAGDFQNFAPTYTVLEYIDGDWKKTDSNWIDTLSKKYNVINFTSVKFAKNGNRIALFDGTLLEGEANPAEMDYSNSRPYLVEVSESGDVIEHSVKWYVTNYDQDGITVEEADFDEIATAGSMRTSSTDASDATSADADASDATSADADASDATSANADASDATSADADASDATSADADASDATSADADASDSEANKEEDENRYMGVNRPYPRDFALLDNGDIIILDSSVVFQYSADGEYKNHFENSSSGLPITGNNLVTYDWSKELRIFDLTSDSSEPVKKVSAESLSSNYSDIKAFSVEDSIYFASNGGLFSYKIGEEEVVQLTRDEMLSFMMPSSYIQDIVGDGSGGFYTSQYPENAVGAGSLMHVFHIDETPVEITDEINVYSFYENYTIRQAIALYRKDHLNVKINYNVGFDYENSASSDDVVRAFNVELLAGKGADLIMLDNLPIDSYIDKGVLEDISGWIDTKKTSSNWSKPILEAYKIDGKTYALPTGMMMPVIVGQKEAIDKIKNLDDLVAFAETNKEKSLLYDMNRVSLTAALFPLGENSFVDVEGNIIKEELSKFLTSVKKLIDVNPGESPGEKEYKKWGYDPEESIQYMDSANSFRDMGGVLGYAFGESAIDMGAISSTSDYQMIMGAIKKAGGELAPLPFGDKKVFMASGIFGLNAASENKEIVYELMDVLLSKKVQSTFGGYGLSIDIDNIKPDPIPEGEGIDSAMAMSSFSIGDGEGRYLEFGRFSEKDADELIKFVNELDTVLEYNGQLQKTILIESKEFFAGNMTADEASEKIIQASRIFMSE